MKVEASTDPKSKRKAILRLYSGKALTEIGGSKALLIPKIWADIYAWNIDGTDWVELTIYGNTIIIKPMDKKLALQAMEANNASPEA